MSFWNDVDEDVNTAAKELAGNWKKFESFGWRAQPECADECAIIYLSNRDSEPLDKSNEASILEALREFTGCISEGDDVEVQSHNHWAVGYVDGIVIRCVRDGEVTKAFEVLHGLMMRLAEYPILDEDDLSEREGEAELEAWESYGASDFRSELAKLAPHHASLFHNLDKDVLYETWVAIAENTRGGERCIHEGDGVCFAFDRTFGKRAGAGALTWQDVRPYLMAAIAERMQRAIKEAS